MILPGKAVRAAVNAAAIAVDGVSPTSFPIGREGLGDHLFCSDLFENFQLGRRRFPDIFGRVFIVRIRRVFDVSHICNNNASMGELQDR